MAFLPRSSTCAVSQTMTNRRSRWRASFSASPGCNRRMPRMRLASREEDTCGDRGSAARVRHATSAPLVAISSSSRYMHACLRAFDPGRRRERGPMLYAAEEEVAEHEHSAQGDRRRKAAGLTRLRPLFFLSLFQKEENSGAVCSNNNNKTAVYGREGRECLFQKRGRGSLLQRRP